MKNLIAEFLKEYLHRQPCITTEIQEQVPDLEIKPELFKIAIRNLLNNAIKYSKPSGPPVSIKVKTEEKQVMLEIRACGGGIPAEELPLRCQTITIYRKSAC